MSTKGASQSGDIALPGRADGAPAAASSKHKPDFRKLRERIAHEYRLRAEAIAIGTPQAWLERGFVPAECQYCQRFIATSAVDRANGEPPILMEFDDPNRQAWTCFDCHDNGAGSTAAIA